MLEEEKIDSNLDESTEEIKITDKMIFDLSDDIIELEEETEEGI